MRSIVYLVGAGPGDPGLITVAGLRALRHADVVIYDRLVNPTLLNEASDKAELIDVGKARGSSPVPQDEISRLIVDRARAGLCVVRLKGGDPFIFGRGFEELTACREHEVPCVVIPGVTSAVAAPEVAGIPLTLRGVSRSFAVLTAETSPETDNAIDFAAIRGIDTLVILMGRSKLETIACTLVESGWPVETPVACVEQATRPAQRVITGTLTNIAAEAEKAQLAPPMVTVIGPTAAVPSPLGSGPGEGYFPLQEESWGECGGRESQNLRGKSVLITRPRRAARKLARSLQRLSAVPVICPLIRVEIPRQNSPLDATINRLGEYKWLAFTSTHAVTAFQRRLVARGFDVRRLVGCKLAALGAATARTLRSAGLFPDVTARDASELARNMIEGSSAGGRVLWPRGDRALPTLRDALSKAGFEVTDPAAYRSVDVVPPPRTLERFRSGVDAVLLYSPSAAVQLASLDVHLEAAIIVCIGPTTAAAAKLAGLHVEAVAAAPTDDAVLAALGDAFGRRKSADSPLPKEEGALGTSHE